MAKKQSNQKQEQTNNNTGIYSPQNEDKFVAERFSNVQSDLIEITHDKLKNILGSR